MNKVACENINWVIQEAKNLTEHYKLNCHPAMSEGDQYELSSKLMNLLKEALERGGKNYDYINKGQAVECQCPKCSSILEDPKN